MAITGQRLLTELGNRAWSGVNKDDMIWGNEEALTAQAELNSNIRYLFNLEDFPFKAEEQDFKTRSGNITYSAPDGQIETIINLDTRQELTFIKNINDLDATAKGSPTHYYIDYFNPEQPTLKLYPIPVKQERFRIVYNVMKPVKSADGYETKYEFENADDVINLPSTIDFLFMDCLVLKTMATNNKDEQDENYRPTIAEFEQAWRVFKQRANATNQSGNIVYFTGMD
jgi:hypothetical protein